MSEEVVWARYMTVYSKMVRFPPTDDGAPPRVLPYDVVGHPQAHFSYAISMPFHPYTDGRRGGEVTLVRAAAAAAATASERLCAPPPPGRWLRSPPPPPLQDSKPPKQSPP